MPSSSGSTAAQRCDVGVALMSGEPAEHHCPQNVAFLRRVGARIAQRTIGNEGVKQTALLEEIDEERQLPEHRRRRLLVPFDMHRTPKAVEINASRRIAFDNQGLLTRLVSRQRRGIARHALKNARYPPIRKISTAVFRFMGLSLELVAAIRETMR